MPTCVSRFRTILLFYVREYLNFSNIYVLCEFRYSYWLRANGDVFRMRYVSERMVLRPYQTSQVVSLKLPFGESNRSEAQIARHTGAR